MDKNKGILIFQRILPHYRMGFFKRFAQKYKDSQILYGQPFISESLKNAEKIEGKYFQEVKNYYFTKNGKIFISEIYRIISKSKPGIIISVFNTGNLNIYLIFFLKIFFRYKIILWSFGYDPERGFNPENNFSDRIRLFLSEKADAVIFYWDKGKKEVEKYSKSNNHFFVAPNTLDTGNLFLLKEEFDRTGNAKIKEELKVKEKFHFVYIGRLIKDKEVDKLIRAFSILQTKETDVRLTIIGDGPERNNLEKLVTETGVKNLFFTGEILDEKQTGKWIFISDAFVMPGRLGLSVAHSFCFGTPVLSQKKEGYFHGEGVGYIKDGINGYLTEDKNVNLLSEKMSDIISDPELSSRLRENAYQTAKNECSIDAMLNGFQKAIEYVDR